MTQRTPEIGESVIMSSMGDDVEITIEDVPSNQPILAIDGLHIIVDQYGEHHLIDLDGDTWVTTPDTALSDDGFAAWMGYCARTAPSIR